MGRGRLSRKACPMTIGSIGGTARSAAASSGRNAEDPEARAEPFAPGTQRRLNGLSGRAFIELQRLHNLVPKPPRSINRALLVASIIISLVPTAIILGLIWQSAIKLPTTESTISKSETARFVDTQQASLPAAPQQTEVKPEIVLTTDSNIESKSGEDVPFHIAIHSGDALPARSNIAIRAIPPDATFSQGRPYGSSDWSLTPNQISDLRLHLPKGAPTARFSRAPRPGSISPKMRARR